MAYIQIVEFDDVTIDQFTDALATVKGSGMEGLILDLRGNPGGSLDAVVKIARKLLPEGMIVYTEDKAGKRTEYTCDGKTPLEVPLVVLVDMNSARRLRDSGRSNPGLRRWNPGRYHDLR